MRPLLSVALLAVSASLVSLAATGCGSSRQRTTAGAPTDRSCVLSARQRRDVAAARREIAAMHRLEAPLTRWRPHGPPALELAVNRFLLDVGPLPADTKGRLMDEAKSAVGLCGDCFDAIEALEPTGQTRLGRPPCVGR